MFIHRRPPGGLPHLPLVGRSGPGAHGAGGTYPGVVLDLSSIDLEEVADALADRL
jgi:hypothetical protein